MQLDQELIRTGLWHRDRLVRELVGFWVKEQTPALSVRSDEIARTYEQFGLTSISHLQPRRCDNRLLDWILQESKHDFGEVTLGDFQAYHVWNWLVEADLDLIAKRLPDIQAAVEAWHARHNSKQTQLNVLPYLEARLKAEQLGPAECFRQILPRCEEINALADDEAHDGYNAAVLALKPILQIAARPEFASQVLTQLSQADFETSGYELVAMIELATAMRLEEAAPLAISLTEIDWDSLLEAISEYFIVNTSPKLQRLVSEGYDERPWYQQLYLSSVFTADNSLQAASCLRGHLHAAWEVDDYNKVVSLAQNLAMQFCTADVELLDQIYHHNPIDPELAQVAETLYVLNELGQLNDLRGRVWKRAMATVEELHMAEILKADAKQSASAASVHAHTATNDPGRNDPCPCGSGKKYKKCCWLS